MRHDSCSILPSVIVRVIVPNSVSGTYRMFDLLDQALRQGGLVYSTEIRKEDA